ncbi:HEAT repeat domain-containing protein [Xenorhabdus sp. DI]|uniref:HEAT repeat domain-containing protein n=1 Tax=Xenorhabdus doucetiae TaxID=351671 RepID=UPI0019A895E0|nr:MULTISPECIES: HEAT repeat domain-containing protein [unclassified Xenorhabdus]MBD2785034.1 HEAT repeat domain-containing protein [Xenorhabdus sp. 3]MBD2787324.1 HEAT repeat domain-containing protein [Xenorhabdus sp. DI]
MSSDDIENKKELIESFLSISVDKKRFKEKYIDCFGEINICHELELSILNKDADAIDLFLYFGAVIGYNYSCISLLNKLILMQWHYKHEDLAMILQHYKHPSSVDALYQVSGFELEYLDFDDSYALAVKCIWGLGDIGTPEAFEKLKVLSESDNEVVRENSINQLKRYSK